MRIGKHLAALCFLLFSFNVAYACSCRMPGPLANTSAALTRSSLGEWWVLLNARLRLTKRETRPSTTSVRFGFSFRRTLKVRQVTRSKFTVVPEGVIAATGS